MTLPHITPHKVLIPYGPLRGPFYDLSRHTRWDRDAGSAMLPAAYRRLPHW